jgi:hypothetical protein
VLIGELAEQATILAGLALPVGGAGRGRVARAIAEVGAGRGGVAPCCTDFLTTKREPAPAILPP